mmetsp:Transcript_35660/g.92620  ORF Transcript_35660/g.92620 Transcript_35660/m.92620 type:complete len:447 (+) Transcript_35660:182-1522(+)
MSVWVLPAQAALLPPANAPRGHNFRQIDARNTAPATTTTSAAHHAAPAPDALLQPPHRPRSCPSMDPSESGNADHANRLPGPPAFHAPRHASAFEARCGRRPISPYFGPFAPSPPPASSADRAPGPTYPSKPPRQSGGPAHGALGGVQKKKSRFSRSKRRSLGKSKAAAAASRNTSGPYMEPGPPALADLRHENRRKTKRHFRGSGAKAKAARARAAAMTPGGGLFPITPRVSLGAPAVSNEALMGKNSQMARLRSCTTPAPGALTPGERGILGISSPYFGASHASSAPYDPAKEVTGPGLDFFGSNEGLIRPVGSPGASTSPSDSDMSDSGDNVEEDTALPVLRGMELNMGEAENLLRQRQQELRINDQAGYIVQLEDDNLKLRGQMLTMEEELDKLRRLEDEHLNMQERLYLLEEELAKRNDSNPEETETPRSGETPEPRVWET